MVSSTEPAAPQAMPSGGGSRNANVEEGAESALPTSSTVEEAGNVQIYDAAGKGVPFKSLYATGSGEHQRVMVIFIRHFFCGVCQEYLKALAAGITPSSLSQDFSIAIVGCGAPSLISSYIENLGFEKSYPFPIYADQSKELYNLLEMQSNLEIPSTPAKYFQRSLFGVVAQSAVQMGRRLWHGDASSGGPISLNGGEFLYEVEGEEAEVIWCHRMKNTQDHAELNELKEVLKLTEKSAL